MVAERDRVRAGGEQPVGQARRDPDPVRDVLAVDDADVDPELLAETGQEAFDRVAAGPADDVADEEDAHGRSVAF